MNLNLARVCLVLLFLWPTFRENYMFMAMKIYENKLFQEEKYSHSTEAITSLLDKRNNQTKEEQKITMDLHNHLAMSADKDYAEGKKRIDEAYQSVLVDNHIVYFYPVLALFLTFLVPFVKDRYYSFMLTAVLVLLPAGLILSILRFTNNAFSYIVARGLYVQPSVPMILLDVGIYVGLMGVYLYQIARAGGFSVRDRLLRGEYGRLR